MAAEPPDGTRPAGPQPHRYRQIAESFGEDPGRYDRTRPTYPAALVDRIISASPGRDVLDVGCGTGTAARQFLAAGCPVLGVEPDGRMAEFARRSGVEVEVATFEAWDPAGRNFDAIVAGTAWHWVRRSGAVTFRLGTVLHPGRMAGSDADPCHIHPAPAGQAGDGAGRGRRCHRLNGGQLHPVLRHRGGHRGAGQRSLSAPVSC